MIYTKHMIKGQDYDWQSSTTLETKTFTCSTCSAPVTSNDGYRGWILNDHTQKSERIYICHNCGKSNCFDSNGVQSPPLYKIKEDFPPHIEKLSPEFVLTFNQARSAEQLGLDKITGPGFRRALEFLIKDFLVSQIAEGPDAEKQIEAIRSKNLSQCIDDIDYKKIKVTAKAATYLGNDATHYTKKWPDKDIQDLKRFIHLVVYWVETELSTNEMQEDMGV